MKRLAHVVYDVRVHERENPTRTTYCGLETPQNPLDEQPGWTQWPVDWKYLKTHHLCEDCLNSAEMAMKMLAELP